MESHEIREENNVLRVKLGELQEKLRLLADALEKQNVAVKNWAQRCSDLEDQLKIAQDAINTQEQVIINRDTAVAQLSQIIEQMRKEQNKQRNDQSEEAKKLQNDIEQQHKKFLETLNKLNQAKVPAKQSFELQNQLIMQKDGQINDLKNKLQDALDGKEAAEHALDISEAQGQKMKNELDTLLVLNEQLKDELKDAKSGREEMKEIEELKVKIDSEQQKVLALHRQKKQLRAVALQLQKQVAEKDSIIQQLQEMQHAYENQIFDKDKAIEDLNKKIDTQNKKISKILQNERSLMDKAAYEAKRAEALEKEVQTLEEEKRKISDEKNDRAKSRIKQLKAYGLDKDKMRELQIRVRQEMEKRLDAEEAVFGLKEQITELKKENALLQEKVIDAQGADIEPLVELLKDLRVETVAVDGDLLKLIDEIPESRALFMPEIPPGICESAAAMIAQIAAQFQDVQIENRELRILLDKFSRLASIYHKISSVVAKYPILSADDIATQEDRGNWVLPIETEHLQRTIVKLHDILIRRK